MNPASATAPCPRCGAALPADAPEGLCPRCLAALPLGPETELTGGGPAAKQPPLSPEELAPHFPQLEILQYLGRGGMGVVYKARQKSLNRLVALKLLAPERVGDAKFAERFTREAHALAALNHPHIVTVHDFGQAGGFYFLLMEFVDGVTLRQAMSAGRFTPEQALAVVPPVCEALQYAHEHGIVHRDIKPENLLMDKAGRVKVADFGIARILDPGEPTATVPAGTQPAGTPQYMAPEEKPRPRPDHRTDIYSLGVVLYEMLTGELPTGNLRAPSRKVQVDVRLDEIVLRALEVEPERRFQTVAEMRTQVERIGTSPAVRPARWILGRAALFAAGTGAVIPTIFYWLKPWAAPWLSAQAQEVMLLLGLVAALLGCVLGAIVWRSRDGRWAVGIGAANTVIWLLFFVAGQLSTPLPLSTQPRVPQAVAVVSEPPPVTPQPVTPTALVPQSVVNAARKNVADVKAKVEMGLAIPYDLLDAEHQLRWAEAMAAGKPREAASVKRDQAKLKITYLERQGAAGQADPDKLAGAQREYAAAEAELNILTNAQTRQAHLVSASVVDMARDHLYHEKKRASLGVISPQDVEMAECYVRWAELMYIGDRVGAATARCDELKVKLAMAERRSGQAQRAEMQRQVAEAEAAISLAQRPLLEAPVQRFVWEDRVISGNGQTIVIRQNNSEWTYLFYAEGNLEREDRSEGGEITSHAPDQNRGAQSKEPTQTFSYRRDILDPNDLLINERHYDLRQGRVFILRDDGTCEQRALAMSIGAATDSDTLGVLFPTFAKPMENLAFGPTVNGTQVALEPRSSAESIVFGKPVEMAFRVRNDFGRTVYIRSKKVTRQDGLDTVAAKVESEDGKLKLSSLGKSNFRDFPSASLQLNEWRVRALPPGAEIECGACLLTFLPDGPFPNGEPISNYVHVPPGRYAVQYEAKFLRSSLTRAPNGSPEWQGGLETGKAMVDVVPPPSSEATPPSPPSDKADSLRQSIPRPSRTRNRNLPL